MQGKKFHGLQFCVQSAMTPAPEQRELATQFFRLRSLLSNLWR